MPEAFAVDTERIARFLHEAKTLASLNHPNISHIHGLEESNGVRALVMELVEGEDFAPRIARGAIPVDEAPSTAPVPRSTVRFERHVSSIDRLETHVCSRASVAAPSARYRPPPASRPIPVQAFKREISTLLYRTHCNPSVFCQPQIVSKTQLYDLYEEKEHVTLNGKTFRLIVAGLQDLVDEAVRRRQKVGDDVATCFSQLATGLTSLRLEPPPPAAPTRIVVDQARLAGLYGGRKSQRDPPEDAGLPVAAGHSRQALTRVTVEFDKLPMISTGGCKR